MGGYRDNYLFLYLERFNGAENTDALRSPRLDDAHLPWEIQGPVPVSLTRESALSQPKKSRDQSIDRFETVC